MFEETGISVKPSDVKALGITKKYNFRSKDSDQDNQRSVEYFYVVLKNYFDIKINNTEDKHDQFLWIDIAEVQAFFKDNFISDNSKIDLEFLSFFKK